VCVCVWCGKKREREVNYKLAFMIMKMEKQKAAFSYLHLTLVSLLRASGNIGFYFMIEF